MFKCRVEGEEVVIRLPIEHLVRLTSSVPDLTHYNVAEARYYGPKVIDRKVLASDVSFFVEEDHKQYLEKAFDLAIRESYENGSEAFEDDFVPL